MGFQCSVSESQTVVQVVFQSASAHPGQRVGQFEAETINVRGK